MTVLPPSPSGQHYNLLEEALIRVVLKKPSENAADATAPSAFTETRLTLPDTLAALMRDEVASFPAMRPHHRPAWHMFASQLGALALLRAQSTTPPEDGKSWKNLLRTLIKTEIEAGRLAGNLEAEKLGDAPWCLVVEDQTLPAFLQPPTPTPLKPSKKEPPTFVTPDEMDLTVTAKNFDLKRSIIREAQPDNWFFALVTFQTMNGYTGRGHQGISRMNGGFSSRPLFSFCPLAGGLGAQIKRDMTAMLESRKTLLSAQYPYHGLYAAPEKAQGLLWLLPWDGGAKSGVAFSALDLWFIEVCRRLRLVTDTQGTLLGMEGTAEKPRVADGKERLGNTGDFWAPLELPKTDKEGNATSGLKAFSPTGQGFTNAKLCDILFGELKGERYVETWKKPPAFHALPSEQHQGMWLDVAALTRGQGKTEGYHERRIFFGPALSRRSKTEPALLCHMASQQLKDLALLNQALRAACAQLAAAGGTARKEHGERVQPYRKLLDQKADASFFTQLNTRMNELEKAGGSPQWGDKLRTQPCYITWLIELVHYTSHQILPQAMQGIPCPRLHVQRARVRAWRRFWWELNGEKSTFSAAPALRKAWEKEGANPTDPPEPFPASETPSFPAETTP